MLDAVKIHPEDDVMVALHDLPAGTEVEGIVLLEDVKQAHKFAIHDMKAGELLHKYGNVIGRLKCDVKKGQWIHSDELGTALDEAPTYHYQKGKVTPKKESQRTWQGYLREDGRAGTRNDLFLIPTVGCVNLQLQTLREKFLELHPEMKGRVQIANHPYGCSQLGGDFENTASLLSGIAHNPNAGGVLVLGLGCENNRLSEFVKRLSDIPEKRLRYFNSQDYEDEIEHGLAMLEELYFNMKDDSRVTLPLSKLTLGLKCGGSDGFSGLTANPLLGLAADEIGACGGQVGLTEVPEMFGAEQDLMNRAKDEATYKKVVALIENFKAYYARNNQPCYENPSPGNKDGGITTLEEKSNGCVLKGGHLEVEDVLDYGERFHSPGLSLLNGPGNDIVASTNLLAAGATIICFTTGRGTPFSSIVPTLKLATNHKLASFKSNWIDFDCQVVFEKGFEEAKEELLDLIVRVASGEKSKGEEHGMAQIALFKTGVTL